MKNKRFVVTKEHAARVAGVSVYEIARKIPKPTRVLARGIYKINELKRLFPETYNHEHAHLTYSRFSEFIRDHLLTLFYASKFAMKRGFTRYHLMSKSSYTQKQINAALWLHPNCFYAEGDFVKIRNDAPRPTVRHIVRGRKPRPKDTQAASSPAPVHPLVTNPAPIKTPQVLSDDIPPRMRNPWEEFLYVVRRKKPLISMWFDYIEFKQTSLVTAQLTVDERDSLCAEFIQQRDLIPWMEARFAELGFPMSLEVVIKRVRKQDPEPVKRAEKAVVALPEPPTQKQPKKGLVASALAAFRKFIERVVLP